MTRRETLIPYHFAAALKHAPRSQTAWDALAASHRREHIDAIEGAKRPETRQRRIENMGQACDRILQGVVRRARTFNRHGSIFHRLPFLLSAPGAINVSGAALPFAWARDYNHATFVPVLGEGVGDERFGDLLDGDGDFRHLIEVGS